MALIRLRQTTPYLQFFKKENPYFATLAWMTPDDHVFLRACRPEAFGDAVGTMRPDIVDANKERQQYDGYMIAKRGLQYRLVQPVSYQGEYLGVLQFGLKGSQLLDAIHDKFNLPVGLAIANEKFSVVTIPELPSLAVGSHTIQSKQIALFKSGGSGVDWSLDQQQVILEDKTYIIANALNLLNYRQELQGYIFIALDISEQTKNLQSRIVFILVLSGALLLLSFVVLYSSYGSLVQKIVGLNQALEQSNQDLEQKVEQRTHKLQTALDEIKTLEGILPLCSYCKKIRNEQDEWEEVDAYIYQHSHADISHSICPQCIRKHFPEYEEE